MPLAWTSSSASGSDSKLIRKISIAASMGLGLEIDRRVLLMPCMFPKFDEEIKSYSAAISEHFNASFPIDIRKLINPQVRLTFLVIL